MEHDLRRDQGVAGVPTDRPETPRVRWYQLIALVSCLVGIAIAVKWPGGWGVTLAFGGFFVAVVLEWIRNE